MDRLFHLDKFHEVSLIACQLLHMLKDTREGIAVVVDQGDLTAIFQKHQCCVGGYK